MLSVVWVYSGTSRGSGDGGDVGHFICDQFVDGVVCVGDCDKRKSQGGRGILYDFTVFRTRVWREYWPRVLYWTGLECGDECHRFRGAFAFEFWGERRRIGCLVTRGITSPQSLVTKNEIDGDREDGGNLCMHR